MTRKIAAALAAVLASSAYGQEMPGAEGPADGPPLGDGPRAVPTLSAAMAKRAVPAAKRMALSAIDVESLLDEDARRASVPALRADPRVAVVRRFRPVRAPSRLGPDVTGVTELPDGSLVWSAEVSAPGARGLRLHVAQCELPDGAELTVSNADAPGEAYGPIAPTAGGRRGEFLLPTVFGETARVELRVPAESAGRRLRFSIDRVAQRYRERGEGLEDPRVGVVVKATTCNNNVACDSSYVKDVARAVATMEVTAADGVFLCTGALLVDSEEKTSIPYFLTAHHCVSLDSEARNTEFYFDYRASTCSGGPPLLSSVPRVSGATLLATSQSSDFSLLRLTGTMPANRFFCGWSAQRQSVSQPVIGVHHPGGSHMRISYGTLIGEDGNFHEVQWSSGVTAGGSSGSPLFNPQKQVIGQLYGGASACSLQDGIDDYGRFDRTYSSVSQWLGTGSGPGGDAYDPGDDRLSGATLLVPVVSGESHGSHVLSSDDTADWFAFDLFAGARYRFFSEGLDDINATLYSDPLAHSVVASDDDSAGTLQFSLDYVPPATGRYFLKVAADPALPDAEYTLHYAEVDTSQKRTPSGVHRLRRNLANSTVTLRWKDRARNEAGYYVEMSNDGGTNWFRVGELPRNSTRFDHAPGPGDHLYRVGAWNEAGVLHWRQVAVSLPDTNRTDASDPADNSGDGATILAPSSGGSTGQHSLSNADAEDWYSITMTSGRLYTVRSTGTSDPYGELFADAGGSQILRGDDDRGAGRNFEMTYRAPRTATVWLRVTRAGSSPVAMYAVAWEETSP